MQVNVWFLCHIYCTVLYCTVLVSVLVRITLPLLFRLSLVRFFLRRFRFIWVSAQKKIPHEATDMNTMFSGPVCHMWPTERKYIFCAMPQGRWRHFLPHHYSEPIIHRVVRPLLSLMKPLRHSAHLKNKNSTLSLEPHRKNAHLMWLTKKIEKINAKVANFALKGQCQEIFGTLFIKKTPTANWAPYEQTVLRYFLFSRRYSRKMCVHVVNDYADIVSA